jgi:two-component system chemotaxis response regulator CheY
MKALIVDDSTTMRRILTNVLRGAGVAEIAEAANGQEAVDQVAAGGIGLVLMDWNMPVMTGIEALKIIRDSGDKTPIIMVTTEAEKTRVIEALRTGANNFIIKPFRPDGVVEKIQEFLTD